MHGLKFFGLGAALVLLALAAANSSAVTVGSWDAAPARQGDGLRYEGGSSTRRSYPQSNGFSMGYYKPHN
jgi:hypothetical protein